MFHGTKREARRALAELVAAVQADHRSLVAHRPALGILVKDYLADGQARGLKPTTLYGYAQLWKIAVEELGDKCPDELHPVQIDRYFQHLLKHGRGAPTVNRLRAFMSAVGNWAVDKRMADTHPFAATTKIRHRTRPTRLGRVDQIRAVYRRALEEDLEIALVIRLGATLGSRRGEISGQRWPDIDFAEAQVRRVVSVSNVPDIEVGDIHIKGTGGPVAEETKAYTDEWHPVDPETLEMLRQHRISCEQRAEAAGVPYHDEGYIFSSEMDGSRPLLPDTVTKRVKKLAESVPGCGWVRPKHLRIWTSTMIEQRFGLGTSAQRLDHSGEVTAKHYTGRDPERERLAAEALADLLDNDDADED